MAWLFFLYATYYSCFCYYEALLSPSAHSNFEPFPDAVPYITVLFGTYFF